MPTLDSFLNSFRLSQLLKGELPLEFYRNRLIALYEQYNPKKLDTIDHILDEWKGKEDEVRICDLRRDELRKRVLGHFVAFASSNAVSEHISLAAAAQGRR